MSKILFVGEDNPYGSAEEYALYPRPDNCSGHRLMRILGLSEEQYLDDDLIARQNLCIGSWSMKGARAAARVIVQYPIVHTIVMLGRKVTTAFLDERGYEDLGQFGTHTLPAFGRNSRPIELHLIHFPHPSGRNARLWTTAAQARARDMLAEREPAIPWGSHL